MQSFHCEAPPAELWETLVVPDVLSQWYASEARIEPWEGGRYWVRSRLLGVREARIELFEAQRRLRLEYAPSPGWPSPGEHVIVEDFMIHEERRGGSRATVLRLLGTGVPQSVEWNPALRRLRAAWAVSFSYLQRYLEERGHRALLAPYA